MQRSYLHQWISQARSSVPKDRWFYLCVSAHTHAGFSFLPQVPGVAQRTIWHMHAIHHCTVTKMTLWALLTWGRLQSASLMKMILRVFLLIFLPGFCKWRFDPDNRGTSSFDHNLQIKFRILQIYQISEWKKQFYQVSMKSSAATNVSKLIYLEYLTLLS